MSRMIFVNLPVSDLGRSRAFLEAFSRFRRSKLELLGDLLGRETHVIQDRSQEIVEIVRHATGELTEALEAVRLVESRLQEVALALHLRPILLPAGFDTVAGIANCDRDQRPRVRFYRRQ